MRLPSYNGLERAKSEGNPRGFGSGEAGGSGKLVFPVLVPYGQAIKQLAALLPLRHVAIHQGDETSIVGRLEQVHHFVDDDVL